MAPWRAWEGSVSRSPGKRRAPRAVDRGQAVMGGAAGVRPPLSASAPSRSLCSCSAPSASPLPPPLPLQVEGFRTTVAQRLVRMLQICAGHVPGVSALNLLSLLRSSENPVLEDL